MKSPYVSELQPDQVITAILLVHIKDVRQKKSGEPYLSLVLGDRTGDLDAKMWDNVAEIIDAFDRDDFVKVKGLLQIHRNQPQLQIYKMAKVSDTEVDFADFFPSSERNPEAMFTELQEIAAGIINPHLRGLLQLFLSDERLMRLYKMAPAAKNVHHAFLGGLLEHVLSLCALARMAASHYNYVDLDLVLTGIILHDVGKVAELTYDRSFGYSTEGQLLGHIVIGLRMLNEKMSSLPEFPPRLRTLLEHLIVSHHGELEYGSPKTPLFPEALLLHHLDNMDSKMECMRATLAKDRFANGVWTAYNPALDRALLKKSKFLQPEPVPPGIAVEPLTPKPVASHSPATVPQPTAAPKPSVPMPNGMPASASPSAPPPPRHGVSAFAEKLKDAWKK